MGMRKQLEQYTAQIRADKWVFQCSMGFAL